MSEMIERVARAMFEASIAMCDAQNMPPEALNWDEIPEKLPQDSRPMWRSFARAAIGAMSEPSEKMLAAGAPELMKFGRVSNGFCNGWRKAIAAALKETR